MDRHSGKHNNRRLYIIGLLLALLSIASLLYILNSSPIKKEIRKQVAFAIMVPTDNKSLQKNSEKYNSTEKILTYKATYKNVELVISEQAMPDQFVDIPQAYDKFLQQLPTYSSFQSINGNVHLAKPANLHGITLAVMDGKGTLMIVRPNKTIADDDWRRFFNDSKVL